MGGPLLRVGLSALGGCAAALGLLWLMQWMVMPDTGEQQARQDRPVIEFVRLQRDSELRVTERRRPDEPPPQESPPPQVPQLQVESAAPAPPAPDIALNIPHTPLAFAGPYLGPVQEGASRDFIPLSRTAPQYPMRAQRRGLEGWVRVSFLITEEGDVRDVVLIEAEPQGVFDQAAMRAVQQWKFKPQLVNGEPVATRAEQVLSFRLNERG